MSDALWYLATPYSKQPDPEQAWQDACTAAAYLMKQNIRVFCPIAHTHAIATRGGDDLRKIATGNHDFWLAHDLPMMERCQGLIIVQMPKWDESFGVAFEIEHFEKTKKPIVYMRWPINVA